MCQNEETAETLSVVHVHVQFKKVVSKAPTTSKPATVFSLQIRWQQLSVVAETSTISTSEGTNHPVTGGFCAPRISQPIGMASTMGIHERSDFGWLATHTVSHDLLMVKSWSHSATAARRNPAAASTQAAEAAERFASHWCATGGRWGTNRWRGGWVIPNFGEVEATTKVSQ